MSNWKWLSNVWFICLCNSLMGGKIVFHFNSHKIRQQSCWYNPCKLVLKLTWHFHKDESTVCMAAYGAISGWLYYSACQSLCSLLFPQGMCQIPWAPCVSIHAAAMEVLRTATRSSNSLKNITCKHTCKHDMSDYHTYEFLTFKKHYSHCCRSCNV